MNYFIADTHFGHKNILKLCNRPFKTIEEMNNAIISRWNNRIKKNDDIYILGDMLFRCKHPEVILSVLKGHKHLIIGNHDSWVKKLELQKYFVSIEQYLEFSDGNNYLILSHYPMLSYHHEMRENAYMIHGHLHADTNIDFFPILRTRKHILNAGVDINNFTPVTLEELIKNNLKFKESLYID